MASYTISNITSSSAKINVSVSSGYSYYRIFWRKTSASSANYVDKYYTTNFSFTISGLDPDTSYTVNVVPDAIVDDQLGAKTFATNDAPSTSRPSNFSWTTAKVAGGSMNLTATEWNSFQSKINSFRNYKNLSDYSFTTVFTGGTVYATIYNQARTAIQGISGYGTYIPLAVSGEQVLAYHMNQIVAELNAIP